MVNIYTGFSSKHSKTELIKCGNIFFINFFHAYFTMLPFRVWSSAGQYV